MTTDGSQTPNPANAQPATDIPAAEATPSAPPRIVAVVGEIPFAGSRIAQALVQSGLVARVLCPDEQAEKAVQRVAGNTGIAAVRGDIDSPAAVEQAMDGACGACFVSPITMAGRVYRRTRHAQDVARFVDTALNKGVQRLVYHSALGAHASAASQALRDAAAAEERVKAAACKTYIARTGPLMGPGDGFLTDYVATARAGSPFAGIMGYGSTAVQPLYVGDMGRCCARFFLDRPEGQEPGRYALAGPEALTLLDLLDTATARLGRTKFKFHAPLFALKLMTLFCPGERRDDGHADGKTAGLKERFNLLYDSFHAERNDAPRLLGPGESLITLRQTLDELLASGAAI